MTADHRLHFASFLEQKRLEEIRKKYGFGDIVAVEKFVLNCEIAYQMLNVLPDCAIRGGLAVPFHLNDDKFRRLSEDVDMVTSRTKQDAEEAVRCMASKCKWLDIKDPHMPKVMRNKNLPLLTYYCRYRSAVAPDPSEIKLEIFYENTGEYPICKIDPNTKIFGMQIGFEMNILGKEELIGCKMSALSLQTIGVADRSEDMPKHIYDIATLLKTGYKETTITDILSGFERACKEEISYLGDKDQFSYDEILRGISDSVLTTLDKVGLNRLDRSYKGKLGVFKKNLGMRYADCSHVTDILLVWTVAEMVQVSLKTKSHGMTERLARILLELRDMEQKNIDWKSKRKRLLDKHSNNTVHHNIIKNMMYEHALLYDNLLDIRAKQNDSNEA